ncbi:MAG TPA: tripartite tricarboxylate transporter substrate binding protein [Xanthobacteraceae bacterium]|jgi:tripartite-type tricarboxylate transporter receptor subunit TctC|nr:tripartite tricarboxylate transporter substrate binding protein [Xanthobacteraceae bacterium]
MRKRIIAALMVGAFGVLSGLVLARAQESWPSRPLTMVVPFAAGGPVDLLGRIVGQYLGAQLGVPVVIENFPGAGGMPGSQRVARANPDGHTFLLGSIGTHALNQSLYKRPLYNAATDFSPVALIAQVPLVLITRTDFPARDLAQFIAYAKAQQAHLQFGSAGAGTSTHIGCVLLNQVIGIDVIHVPYRGGEAALLDLVGRRLDYMCSILSTAAQPIRDKSVQAIAMLSRARSPVMPGLPTAHEQGLTGFDIYSWNAVFLPKATPPEIVGKLNAALGKVMDDPAVRAKLADLGLYVVDPGERSPGYLADFVRREIDKWAAPIRLSGATGE